MQRNRELLEELPEDLLTYILSKISKGHHLAIASCVCKRWYRASRFVTSLAFRAIDEQAVRFMMISHRDRLVSLEKLAFTFRQPDGVQLFLGVVSTCLKLTTLDFNLDFVSHMFHPLKLLEEWLSGATLGRVFQVLSTLPCLTNFTFNGSEGVLGALGSIVGVRFGALKVLRIHNIKVDFNQEFVAAFPALEELVYINWLTWRHWGVANQPYDARIVSNTLKELTFFEENETCAFLLVQAPKLSRLYVDHVPKVICESSATCAYLKCAKASEVTCNASEVAWLELAESRHNNFPKLVSVKWLKITGYIRALQCPALRSVENASLNLNKYLYTYEDYAFELWSVLNSLKHMKSLGVSTKLTAKLPSLLQLTELKRLQIAFHESDCFLRTLVESSPALEVLDILGNTGSLPPTCEWLFELQRNNPKLRINFSN